MVKPCSAHAGTLARTHGQGTGYVRAGQSPWRRSSDKNSLPPAPRLWLCSVTSGPVKQSSAGWSQESGTAATPAALASGLGLQPHHGLAHVRLGISVATGRKSEPASQSLTCCWLYLFSSRTKTLNDFGLKCCLLHWLVAIFTDLFSFRLKWNTFLWEVGGGAGPRAPLFLTLMQLGADLSDLGMFLLLPDWDVVLRPIMFSGVTRWPSHLPGCTFPVITSLCFDDLCESHGISDVPAQIKRCGTSA